jgi:hypothetical protein
MSTPVAGTRPTRALAWQSDSIRRSVHREHVFQRLLRLREYFELTDPYWAEIVTVQEFLAVAGEYGFETDTARALHVGRTTYVQAIRDGVFTRLVSILQDYDPVDIEGTPGEAKRPLSIEGPIIVGELHCPAIDDAKATFEAISKRKSNIGVEITAAGIGGGGRTRERVFASGSKMTIAAYECAVLCAYLSGYYEIWRHADRKDDLLVLTNVTGVTSLEADRLDNFPDYAESHVCDKPWAYDHFRREIDAGMLVAGREYNEFRTPLALEHVDHTEWEETYEYSGRWGFDASLDGQKIAGGVTYKSTFTTTMKIDVVCPKGYHYISRFRSAQELPQQWAAEPL